MKIPDIKKPEQLTVEDFLKDVAAHEMEILQDGNCYRHLKFKRPGTNNYYFNVVTWPGYLAITGDTGAFVFSRTPDMFEFFRAGTSDGLGINRQYWAEKLVAVDKNGEKTFSPETFKYEIWEWVKQLDEELRSNSDFLQAVQDEVTSYADDGSYPAVRAAIDFEFEGHRPFQDFYEVNCSVYTWSFEWCCFAVAWAVQRYDLLKAGNLPGS